MVGARVGCVIEEKSSIAVSGFHESEAKEECIMKSNSSVELQRDSL